MNPFISLNSIIIPLPIKDVDTDMILPAQYMTSVSRGGYGENVFRRLRDQASDFPFNQERFKSAQIVLALDNFGCGSSREHAVWALMEWGIRVVIAPSFADIFFNNSGKNGLVLITQPQEIVHRLMLQAQSSDSSLMVNLEDQVLITQEGDRYPFSFDPFRKECLLKGYDDLQYLLANKEAILAHQKLRNPSMFFSTLSPNH